MRPLTALLAAICLLLGCLPALAHPHVFVDAKERIVFGKAGDITAIENIWVFDQAYSAWAVQGIDADASGRLTKPALQGLADLILKNLGDYDYYTFAGEGRQDFTLVPKGRPNLTQDTAGHLILDFSLAVQSPQPMRAAAKISINDPTFYVSILVRDISDVSMAGAPQGCTLAMQRGRPMPSDLAAQLYAIPANITQIPASLKQALRGVQDAIVVSCPGAAAGTQSADQATLAAQAPANALDAIGALDGGDLAGPQGASASPSSPPGTTAAPVPLPYPIRPSTTATASTTQIAESSGAVSAVPSEDTSSQIADVQAASAPARMQALPLGVAPSEPGFALPHVGFLGWVADRQRDFYQALVEALARIRSNGAAFWILGGLSFLYGIFHAAGPGHGKLVISSYVLANEHQLRRGVVLSFFSAMVQSAVAVLFVIVAAMLFRMTALAMSDAVNWIGLLSYATIALLGAWLLLRALFGRGHHHAHDHEPAPHADHDHDHDHAVEPHHHHHHHAIGPVSHASSWREQAAMVLGVGLRPCSGALIVLVFALSQGMFLIGVAAVFLMGLGTALTVGVLASLASGTKTLASRLFSAKSRWLAGAGRTMEVAGACIVLGFGITMVLATL